MYEKKDLINNLINMGIKSDDTVLIHSSMKSIGYVKGGADTVLDALTEYLKDGLLVFPTHTWATMSREHNIYDPEIEPSCVGILSNLFLQRKSVIRSLHPTHSLAAYGRDSSEFLRGEEDCTTPCSPKGCYQRLLGRDAKILLIGVNQSKNTFIHCVEEILNVPERFTPEPELFNIVKPDGKIKESLVYRHYNKTTDHISEAYTKLDNAFLLNNAVKKVSFGNAESILCSANEIYSIMKKILSNNLNCLIDLEEIPYEWY